MAKPKNLYTEEEIKLLLELFEQGVVYSEIATRLNRPLESVRSKIKLLRKQGLVGRKRNAQQYVSEEFEKYVREKFPEVTDEEYEYFLRLSESYSKYAKEDPTVTREMLLEESMLCFSLYNKKCPYFGVPFDFNNDLLRPVIASDFPHRFLLISNSAHKIKRSLTHEAFVNMCKKIADEWR